MKCVGIIPARMGSSRFPGKPLTTICGLAMLEHVYRRARLCERLDRVVVATPDEAIAEAVSGFRGSVVMTSPTHARAVDRVAEAAEITGGDVVVVIQGDEPLLRPQMIEAALQPVMDDPQIFCVNVIERIDAITEWHDSNTIKVVMDRHHHALYFSRRPLPADHGSPWSSTPAYKQVCIMPFRRERLRQFARLAPTPLECAESIDMLRILEHGEMVRLVETPYRTHAVDTPADRDLVEQLMEQDPVCYDSCLH